MKNDTIITRIAGKIHGTAAKKHSTIRVGILTAAIGIVMGSLGISQATWTVEKVADLPSFGGATADNPRGGILQIGNDLWFTTFGSGANSDGAIVSYNLTSGNFTLQHSLTGLDGLNPYKTTLAQGADGRVYYAAQYGGTGWVSGNTGGAIGSFNPTTVQSSGVSVLWSGVTAGINQLSYTTPVYVPVAGGGASVYFNTYGGGSAGFGTIQKLTLNSSGVVTATTQISQLTGGGTGKQAQGGLVLAEKMHLIL